MRALPYVIIYLTPAIASGALAIYSWRRRTDQSRPFSLMMAAVAFWSACHALSIASATFEGTLLWAQIQYVGIVLVSPLWALFALAYANRPEFAAPRVRVGLLVPPALALAAVLSNGWHQLWWTSVRLDDSREFLSLAVTRGVLFWLHAAFSYGCVLFGLGLFIYSMLESQLLYRNQARLVVLGALLPFFGNLALLLGLKLSVVDDPTPFLFLGSGAVMFYATRQYQLLDLAPVAQREIFEHMPDGMVVLDRRGTIVALNQPAAQLLAIEAEPWIGRRVAELVDVSPLASATRQLFDGPGEVVATQATCAGPDGSRVVEARRRPLLTGEHSRAGALLLLRDITAQADMQAQLRRRLAELTLLNQIARAANAAAQTDELLRTIAGEIVRTVEWDRVLIGTLQPGETALRVTVDASPHDIRGVQGTLVAAHEFPLIFDIMRAGETRVLSASDPTLADTTTLAAMRSYSLQTALVVPLYRQDDPLGVLIVGHMYPQDITAEELRLYETVGKLIGDAITRAQLYEAADEASALKSAFLATISHELRTPLTSIIGYADMLEGGVFGALPERAAEPLGHVRNNGQALLRLINDILDFSKMEAGHFSVDIYPVDLATVIRAAAGTLQPQIQQRGLQLRIDIAPNLPLVHANSSRIEQVLMNLLSNAVKFTEAGTITVCAAATEDHVRLSVRDTGIGIAPDDMRRLFQPFHQIDNQLTRRYGGTGLGLAISRRLVDLMHGTLAVESTPGAGSTFYCDLRVLPVSALQEAAVAK